MATRKRHCIGDCDFVSYYANQAGRGFHDISVFQGKPYQRGHGIGSLFKRFDIPIVKFLGKHLLTAGINIGKDAIDSGFDKQKLKQSLKDNSRQAASNGLGEISKIITQSGSGRSKRKVYKKTTKRKKRDPFS